MNNYCWFFIPHCLCFIFKKMFKKYTLFSILAVLALWGCDDAIIGPVVELGAAPNLTSPSTGTAFVLEETAVDDNLTTFEWTAADFGYPAGIDYTLQLDAAGADFAEAITIGVVNDLSFSDLSIGKLNNIMLAKGLPFGFANEMEVRVCASVSPDVESLCSQAVSVTINPFQAEVVYPFLTVPGDYQGWDPADENYKVFSRKSDDIYEGYIYFDVDAAVYKFAQGLSWDVNWGDIDPADGTLDMGGIDNNIPINDGKGMYLLHCDLNTLTHFNLKTDWGVLGDATPGGWDTDTDFAWDAARGVLSVTLDLGAGEIKFRANDTWDVNFGDDFTNGTLEADGANIPVAEAGNYTIDLILNVADYNYTITKN